MERWCLKLRAASEKRQEGYVRGTCLWFTRAVSILVATDSKVTPVTMITSQSREPIQSINEPSVWATPAQRPSWCNQRALETEAGTQGWSWQSSQLNRRVSGAARLWRHMSTSQALPRATLRRRLSKKHRRNFNGMWFSISVLAEIISSDFYLLLLKLILMWSSL